MITFRLGFINPFKAESFISFYTWTGAITKHKFWEVQVSHYAREWLAIELDLGWFGKDHAGPRVELNLFGYTITAQIYDHRHWDDYRNSWEYQ